MNGMATIALAGNPNSGKTTLFNAITGARQRVGNYPGITVERKEGAINLEDVRIKVVDLPGCYSLSAYSQEELVARKVLVNERPDVVVDIVDATKLERHLYLAVQFFELGIPVVLALNMMDEAGKQGLRIDRNRLSSLLNCPVVETVARSGQGKQELMKKALDHARQRGGSWEPLKISYGPDLDMALSVMEQIIESANFMTHLYPARWVALKYLEGDEEVVAQGKKLGAPARELEELVEKTREHCRMTLKTSPEAIIADYRYGLINSVLRQDVLTRELTQHERIDVSARLDSILTNRLLGPVIMFGILYALFQITFTVGEIPMSWLESFFGWLGDNAAALIPAELVQSLIVSGIIDGVGGVMGFVPLIAIMFLITLFAWTMALLVSRLLRSTIIKGEPTPFVMELPPYRLPTLRGILIHSWERVWQYIRKAGTVILAVSILLWAAMTFPGLPEDAASRYAAERQAVSAAVVDQEQREAQMVEIDNLEAQATLRHSVAGRIGSFFEPVSQWAGFDWRTNIALVGGFAAKEVIVSTFGTAYSLGEVDPEESASLSKRIAADPAWNQATALALIIFVLLYAPCFVTVVTMARESSWRWALFSTCFNTLLGFGLAVLAYQVGSLLLVQAGV